MSDSRTPDEMLALATVAQACVDMRAKRGSPTYANAHNWIMSEGFEFTCAEADVCPIRVRRTLREQGLL